MSRCGYGDYEPDYDNAAALWERSVKNALCGRRGQAFLRELGAALEALPVKRLIANSFVEDGEVCALGALATHRRVDMSDLDPDDYYLAEEAANRLGIARCLAAEVMWLNDELSPRDETPERRYERMLRWTRENLTDNNT